MTQTTKILNLQLSIFGNFSRIQPNTSLVIKLLSNLKDKNFMPGALNSTSVNAATGKLTVNSRLQLYSPNKEWVISFLDERIDFNYLFNEKNPIQSSFDPLIKEGNSLITSIFNALDNNIKGNRLAVNLKTIFDDMSEEKLKKIGKELILSPTKEYEKDYTDWRISLNSRGKFNIGKESSETCNRILEFLRYNYIKNNSQPLTQSKQHKTLMIALDLNTLPQNLETRFTGDNLKFFSNDVKQFIQNNIDDIKERYL